MMKLLAATNNQGKLREIQSILRDLPVEVVTPRELGLSLAPEETGRTFEENALIKARAFCEASGLPALADDSGLCVRALDGAPGIRSARYGAPEAVSDRDRYNRLLHEMEGVADRTAHFICYLACVFPDGDVLTARGEIAGELLCVPRGVGGFGYDPIFLIPSEGRTMAELSDGRKNKISHRARALGEFREKFSQSGNLYRGGDVYAQ